MGQSRGREKREWVSDMQESRVLQAVLLREDRAMEVVTQRKDWNNAAFGHRQWSLLHLAVWAGHINLVRWLLAAGASTEPRDAKGDTPLSLAVELGDAEMQFLLTAEERSQATVIEGVVEVQALRKDESGLLFVVSPTQRSARAPEGSAKVTPW